jgi:hypothetical protein
VVTVEADEELKARRGGSSLGEKTVRQIRETKQDITRVSQPDYCWGKRQLPDAILEENAGGLSGAVMISGEATYFGKYDSADEGTGTPAFEIVQTNSSVFGVSLPQAVLVKHGLAKVVNRRLRATAKGLAAQIEVYVPKKKRLAKLPLVDVGPSTKAVADLTVAAVAWLQGEPEEKADGYKINHPQVQIYIPT